MLCGTFSSARTTAEAYPDSREHVLCSATAPQEIKKTKKSPRRRKIETGFWIQQVSRILKNLDLQHCPSKLAFVHAHRVSVWIPGGGPIRRGATARARKMSLDSCQQDTPKVANLLNSDAPVEKCRRKWPFLMEWTFFRAKKVHLKLF